MNIPNILTVARFIIIPFFGFYLGKGEYTVAAILFTVGGLTDILDGFIARRFHMMTSWGKLADPLADKLMQITALIVLTLQQKIPLVVLIVVMAKESFMGIGSILLYKQDKYVVSASWYGKMATVVFYFAIIISIFNEPYSKIFISIAVLATLFAFFMYSMKFREIKQMQK